MEVDMATKKTYISIDEDTRKQAEELFDNLGLSLSAAVSIFLKRALLERGIPFDVSEKLPDEETISAMDEVKQMEEHPEKYAGYRDIESLKRALGI